MQPTGLTRELPDDIDALSAELRTLRTGQLLAISDWSGTWMRPRVVLLVPLGHRPTAVLSGVEFLLLGHARGKDRLDLTIEGAASGTRGTLRLAFPQQGWRLHAVARQSAPAQPPPAAAPPPASAPAPARADAEKSARRRQDDIFRKIFS